MPATARSLAEDLRGRSDRELAEVLRLRPSLLRPVPKSFADLALRINSAASVSTALDDLNAASIDVLTGACALTPDGRFDVAKLATGLGASQAGITAIVADLRARVLLWGSAADIRIPSAVREAFGPRPGGLDAVARPALRGVALALADPAAFADRVHLLPADVQVALQHAAWHDPVIPIGPVADVLARTDFVVTDEFGVVTLPREIALLLRGGRLLAQPRLTPPDFATVSPDQAAAADRQAGLAADQFVRDVDRTLGHLQQERLTRQASGAFPIREWDRLAALVAMPHDQLSLTISLAATLGWIAWHEDGTLRPTTVYLSDRQATIADRWARLIATWLASRQLYGSDPNRVLIEPPAPQAPGIRRLVLAAVAAGARQDITAWLQWSRPRRDVAPPTIATTLAQCEWLGLTFGSVPAAPVRIAVDTTPRTAQLIAAIRPLLPPLTDRIVLQADLTATALGPLTPDVEWRLARIAERESGGAASVYRFTPDTLRSALAAGEQGADLLAWLQERSATPVPQALSVLVQDLAAVTASLQVSPASCVLVGSVDDIAAMLADESLRELGLHRVADTVVVSQASATEVAQTLRGSGRVVAAAPDDTVVRLTPESAPAAASDARPEVDVAPTADPDRIVTTLRRVESQSGAPPGAPRELRPAGPADVRSSLSSALADHRSLWLGFALDDGDRLTSLVEPLSLDSGDLIAFDVTAGEVRTIPLERIIALAAV